MPRQPFAHDAGRPPVSVVPSGADTPIPEPPEYLEGSERWVRLWTVGRSWLSNEAHYDLMVMVCEVAERLDALLAAARKARNTVRGSQGQPRLNPIFKEVRDMETHLASLLERANFQPDAKRKAPEPRKRNPLADLQRESAAR